MHITSIKCNLSERKIGKFLNYLNSINGLSLFELEEIPTNTIQLLYLKDRVSNRYKLSYLNHVQNAINVTNTFVNKSRRGRQERSGSLLIYDKRKMSENPQRENMNEVWARMVDLPGLEDNISPNNNIDVLLRFVVNEVNLSGLSLIFFLFFLQFLFRFNFFFFAPSFSLYYRDRTIRATEII